METELRGRALFFSDMYRVLAWLQVVGVGLGGFLIALGSAMPWVGYDELSGPSGLTFAEGKVTFALGLLTLLVAGSRAIDRSNLVRWLTVFVSCGAGVTAATLARMQMYEISDLSDSVLGFFAPADVAHGLRLTFAGGIVTAAMSLLNVIPILEAGADQVEASVEGAHTGQS